MRFYAAFSLLVMPALASPALLGCSSSPTPSGTTTDAGGSTGGKSGSGGGSSTGGAKASGGSSSSGGTSSASGGQGGTGGADPALCAVDAGADECLTCFASQCCSDLITCLGEPTCKKALEDYRACFHAANGDANELSICFGDFGRTLQAAGATKSGIVKCDFNPPHGCTDKCGGPIIVGN
jgi:hypothetical protein